MKRTFSVVLALSILLAACAKPKEIDGVVYDSYGLLNQDSKKNECIEYELVWGNLIWGAVLIETVVFPIYFFGFSIFQPVGHKQKIKGAIGGPADPSCRQH
jgi:hypothetical protein